LKNLIVSLLFLSPPALASMTYSNTIKAIFKARCSQCHDRTPNTNWQIYQIAYDHREDIKLQVMNHTMPQGEIMPQNERDDIVRWVNEGAKE
jgi:uncharacterized membrane protein